MVCKMIPLCLYTLSYIPMSVISWLSHVSVVDCLFQNSAIYYSASAVVAVPVSAARRHISNLIAYHRHQCHHSCPTISIVRTRTTEASPIESTTMPKSFRSRIPSRGRCDLLCRRRLPATAPNILMIARSRACRARWSQSRRSNPTEW